VRAIAIKRWKQDMLNRLGIEMKVLALVGSPRKNGNTDILVDKLLEGASSENCSVEKLYLYDMDIQPCVDCRNCTKESFECSIEDDMKMLYRKLEEADVLIFGTPLYWYGPSAQIKLVMDRLLPYSTSNKLKGKKAVLIVPSEEGDEASKYLVGMFELSFRYLEIQLINTLLVKAYTKGEVKEQPDTLRKTLTIGRSLAKS
jgi:multimeric flavodoxin WrbA